ncbi:MAG: hypothetical protein AAF236_01450, partial [Verrucomicrobiota bacterium]
QIDNNECWPYGQALGERWVEPKSVDGYPDDGWTTNSRFVTPLLKVCTSPMMMTLPSSSKFFDMIGKENRSFVPNKPKRKEKMPF